MKLLHSEFVSCMRPAIDDVERRNGEYELRVARQLGNVLITVERLFLAAPALETAMETRQELRLRQVYLCS